VLAAQGIAEPDGKTMRTVDCNVRVCLKNKVGRVVENVAEGMPAKWRLTAS
jgi:hypothetical protein